MVLEAQNNGLLIGLAPDLIDKGVAIMQYADDTVLCLSHDPDKAINLKLLLYLFQLMSRLKINFQKAKFSLSEETMISLASMPTCLAARSGTFL
jgi:hypothetical protein